jgi:hypothetical protein
MLTLFLRSTLLLSLFSLPPAFAQVHGSGGIPGKSGEDEAYCHGKLGSTRDLEREYLESRKIEYRNDQSFFDELHHLLAQNVTRAITSNGFLNGSCGKYNLPAHSADQIKLLKNILSIWKEANRVPQHCLQLFRTRSRLIGELDCVIRSLTPKNNGSQKD